MKLALSCLGLILLSACTTMNFVNGPSTGETVKREHWHNIAIGGLIEVSKPFNVEYYCDNKQWERVKIEFTFPNFLASSATLFANPYIGIYGPWTVQYECRENIDE